MMSKSRLHLPEEEVYDIFRNIFHSEDALAATIQLFCGESWIEECYLHRMKEILPNPTEFGKVVLEEKKKGPLYSKYGFRGLLEKRTKNP